jgi:hypothetical protein
VRLGWAEAARSDLAAGAVSSVELRAGDATFRLEAQRGAPYIVLEAEPEGVSWREPLPALDLAALLGRAFTADPPAGWQAALERLKAWGLR